jgi:predicted aminopeptidase
MTEHQPYELKLKIESQKAATRIIKWSTLATILLLGICVLFLWGCPTYRVYQQSMEGKAKLAEAQSSRQVAIAEARAKMESASLLAQADTLRAHGVARSNAIIGASLKDNKEYLHWLWIDNLDKGNSVIYVPTEANLPIMEASRFAKIPIQP